MNSSNDTRPKRHAVAKGAGAYLFPDISEITPSRIDGTNACDAFHIPHRHTRADGFCDLMQHGGKQGTNSQSAAEAAKIKARAIEKQAYDEGFARGEADARALVEKDFASLFAAVNKALFELERVRKAIETNAEKDAVNLAFAIARKIVYHEVALREETIFEVVREALKQVPDWKSATIRVSPPDYDRIKEKTAAFSGDPAAFEELRLQPDQMISDGDCIIDTPFGMIDARTEKRLEAVESALKSRFK